MWNATGRWQGWADPPLSPVGERQTERAGERLRSGPWADLPPQVTVSSDLIRARRTAELLLAALDLTGPVRLDAGLREYNVGEWSGLSRDEIEARWPGDTERFATDPAFTPPGGESRDGFDGRVREAGSRIAAESMHSGTKRLLIVTHAGVVRALGRAAGRPEHHIGHLAGYWGRCTDLGLFPDEPVDLLEGLTEADATDAGEGTMEPAR